MPITPSHLDIQPATPSVANGLYAIYARFAGGGHWYAPAVQIEPVSGSELRLRTLCPGGCRQIPEKCTCRYVPPLPDEL